jgi:hypothetical protein
MDDWSSGRAFRRPHKRKSEQDWKRELHKEEEEVNDTQQVYVIINEWEDIHGLGSSEIVNNKWFTSEDDAWEALNQIAESHKIDLDYEETSLRLENHNHLRSEEYRIEELNRG